VKDVRNLTERAKPRISLNKLAEYATSGARRRQTILLEQKFSQPFMAACYRDAYEVAPEFLTDPGNNLEMLQAAIEHLQSKPAKNDQQRVQHQKTLRRYSTLSASLTGKTSKVAPFVSLRTVHDHRRGIITAGIRGISRFVAFGWPPGRG
jgi:phage-related minor tail protein